MMELEFNPWSDSKAYTVVFHSPLCFGERRGPGHRIQHLVASWNAVGTKHGGWLFILQSLVDGQKADFIPTHKGTRWGRGGRWTGEGTSWGTLICFYLQPYSPILNLHAHFNSQTGSFPSPFLLKYKKCKGEIIWLMPKKSLSVNVNTWDTVQAPPTPR